MITIPAHAFIPYLPPRVNWIRGQLERGEETGYLHWQIVVGFDRSVRTAAVCAIFGPYNAELTRSDAADRYVFKEDTYIEGTRFELGTKPLCRNAKRDWDQIRSSAENGRFAEIPSDVLVRHYGNLRRIALDNLQPIGVQRSVFVYWGKSGMGKSKLAWEEAGLSAFPKDPRTKFWCGYRDHAHVVCDEFDGTIALSSLLRWLDRYPVVVETKGGGVVLRAEKIWLTSNIDPRDWYAGETEERKRALFRRFTRVVHFDSL